MKYRITTLSPVHIGTGTQLTPFEFAFDGKRFLVADLEKIFKGQPGRADELNRQIARDSQRFSLSEFLSAGEKQTPAFRKYSAGLSPDTQALLETERRKAENMDVAECVKTSTDYQLYLPGSSLKGALRTALAYSILHENETLFQALTRRLATLDWRHADQALNELIFQGSRSDPTYDVFKALSISDSSTLPANEQTLEIGKMKILSLKSPKQAERPAGRMYAQLKALNLAASAQSPLKHSWNIREILTTGLCFEGEITLDEGLLTSYPARKRLGWTRPHQQALSLDRLIQATNRFAGDICDWELHFFREQVTGIDVSPVLEFYQSLKTTIENADGQRCYLCIGQGAGWHKLTIGMLLERAADFDFKALRKKLRLAPNRLPFDFPKSRQLLMRSEEDIQSVFGWIELRIIFP